jgi:hypothetical protein
VLDSQKKSDKTVSREKEKAKMLDSKKPEAFVAEGRPDGKIDAVADSLYLDNSCAVLYVKTTPRGTKTGWFCLGQVLKPAQQAAVPSR